MAVESPMTNCLAAARAATPLSTTWITRTRRSFEYPVAAFPESQKATESYSRLEGNPFDSQSVETALADRLIG